MWWRSAATPKSIAAFHYGVRFNQHRDPGLDPCGLLLAFGIPRLDLASKCRLLELERWAWMMVPMTARLPYAIA